MDNVLFSLGSLTVFKNAAVITLGVLLASGLSLFRYKRQTGTASQMLIMLPLAYMLSVLFGRFLYWYFTYHAYESFIRAITDFSSGSFALQGLILGVWLAAALVGKLRSRHSSDKLLDAAAPGLCLLVAAIRFSSFFTGTCIGNRNLTSPLLQWPPLAIAVTDNAGNTDYRLRVYFIEALLMLVLFAVLLGFSHKYSDKRMAATCIPYGNIAKWFLVLFACIEIVMDSNRSDSILMRFRFLHQLNPYSSFISLAQVFAVILLLAVFLGYLTKSVTLEGFSGKHLKAVALFLVSALLIGATGEFLIQRYGMVRLLLPVRAWGYLSMLLGCTCMILCIKSLFTSCASLDN